jgi:predicted DNA-binding transcriptional regulator AlpA
MPAPPVEPMFLRPREAAALAGLSTRAIYRAIDRERLRAHSVIHEQPSSKSPRS